VVRVGASDQGVVAFFSGEEIISVIALEPVGACSA